MDVPVPKRGRAYLGVPGSVFGHHMYAGMGWWMCFGSLWLIECYEEAGVGDLVALDWCN